MLSPPPKFVPGDLVWHIDQIDLGKGEIESGHFCRNKKIWKYQISLLKKKSTVLVAEDKLSSDPLKS